MTARPLIVSTPDVLFGAPRIAGTRISVAVIREATLAGESVEDLLAAYPHLTREQIEAANAYAAESERTPPKS
jgi:uncharacterized protein (DUF433 family)